MHRLLALLLTLAPLAAHAQPALWALSDDDSTVYLLGSIHLLTKNLYPLSEAIEAAYTDAEVVAFEIDIATASTISPVVLARGLYTDGSTLADHLDPALYDAVNAVLVGYGLPEGTADSMQPWLVTFTLSGLSLLQPPTGGTTTKTAPKPVVGVDEHFFERAVDDEKERVAFETVEEQVDAFAGLSLFAQVALLRESLAILDESASFERIQRAWHTADLDALDTLIREGLDDHPELGLRMFTLRNAAWVPQIEALLAREGEDALVVVGAGHLVGEGSVIDLLQQRGYTVERR